MLASKLQPFVEDEELAGAVMLVADRNQILNLETVGFADVIARRPMQPDTLFWIASQTKPITATALMILVDEGKLSLDDPVEKYLPEFHDLWVISEQDDEHQLLRRPSHPITVRNVLNHTSGLPFVSAIEHPTLDAFPLRDAVRSYTMLSLQFQPDTQFLYSNAGINVAGYLIELLSGLSYVEFMQTRLFDPLGMPDTTFFPNREQISRLATSYAPAKSGSGLEPVLIFATKYPLDAPDRYAFPAGGLFSTAKDTCRFCQMILNEGELDGKRYLSADAVREMTRRQTDETISVGYGLGWGVSADGSFGHGGAYATNMTIDPPHDLIEIFLVQHNGFPGRGGDSHSTFRGAVAEWRTEKRIAN